MFSVCIWPFMLSEGAARRWWWWWRKLTNRSLFFPFLAPNNDKNAKLKCCFRCLFWPLKHLQSVCVCLCVFYSFNCWNGLENCICCCSQADLLQLSIFMCVRPSVSASLCERPESQIYIRCLWEELLFNRGRNTDALNSDNTWNRMKLHCLISVFMVFHTEESFLWWSIQNIFFSTLTTS